LRVPSRFEGRARYSGENIFEIFVDDGRAGNDDAVVIEHRDLAFGIEGQKPFSVLLEAVQIDVYALKIEPLLQQRNHRIERVRRGFGVIIGERHARKRRQFVMFSR
jgi:hypothetical protein